MFIRVAHHGHIRPYIDVPRQLVDSRSGLAHTGVLDIPQLRVLEKLRLELDVIRLYVEDDVRPVCYLGEGRPPRSEGSGEESRQHRETREPHGGLEPGDHS